MPGILALDIGGGLVNNIELAEKEWSEAKAWAIQEGEKVKERLIAEGRLEKGLDGNSEDYAYIDRELDRRRIEIQAKYSKKIGA